MIKVRRANIDDAYKIAQINVNTWNEAYKGLLPDSLLKKRTVSEERVLGIVNKITEPDFIFLVSEYNNEVVGFCCGGLARDENYPFKYELRALYVLPQFQTKGIGKALINEFKKKINNNPFYLYALKSNINAHNFYKKMGGTELAQYEKLISKDDLKIEEVLFAFNLEQ